MQPATREPRRPAGGLPDAEPSDVARHVHPHPALSEAVGEVFLSLAGRGLHQQ
ncbi:hypothetical protein GCM10010256_13950 [Streptomyces coeruleorubidus]|nr:hypothetical protein GCM10010256_13950 [Streptomyces coeruleorubidus]